MNVLEPCAFCGGAGHVCEDGRFSIKPYDFPKWFIVCTKCGIRTPTAKMEQVVRIWNRRAEDESSAEPEKVCIARINLSEEQVHEAVERAKNEIVQMLPSAQPDNQINLCDSCDYLYPECPSEKDDVIFGNGIGNDNICACNKYKPSAQPEIIRCKDCKHRDKYGCCKYWKGLAMADIPIATDNYDFCSYAELI